MFGGQNTVGLAQYGIRGNAVLACGIMPKARGHSWWVRLSSAPGRRPLSFPTSHIGVFCEVAVNHLQSPLNLPRDS